MEVRLAERLPDELTGLHEPQASHLDLLSAFLPSEQICTAYGEALFPLVHSSGFVGFPELATRIINRAIFAAKSDQPFGEVWLDRDESIPVRLGMSRPHLDLHAVEVNV